jgi:hypothetical protein
MDTQALRTWLLSTLRDKSHSPSQGPRIRLALMVSTLGIAHPGDAPRKGACSLDIYRSSGREIFAPKAEGG